MANTIKLKPVQSVGATEIEYEYDQLSEHAITVTYSELKDLRDNKKLIPGIFYRITDFVTTTAQENTISAGYPYDIIVRAVTESSLDENARAALHEGDTHFAKARIDSWVLRYSLDNDQTRFGWADPVNGKGVVYYLKDAWDNECCFDFKNIQYLGSSLYNFTEGLGDILDDTAYYFTFHKVGYGDYSDCNGPDFQDDATNCTGNVIDVYIDDEPYTRFLPKIVMICPENTYNDMIFNVFKGAGVHDFTLYTRFQYNRIDNSVYNVFINGAATLNRFEDNVWNIKITGTSSVSYNKFSRWVHDIILNGTNVERNTFEEYVQMIEMTAAKVITYNRFVDVVYTVKITATKSNLLYINMCDCVNNVTMTTEYIQYTTFRNNTNNITIEASAFQEMYLEMSSYINLLGNCIRGFVDFYNSSYITVNNIDMYYWDMKNTRYIQYTSPQEKKVLRNITIYNIVGESKDSLLEMTLTELFSLTGSLKKYVELDNDGKIVYHWKSSLLTETGYYKDSATDTTWKAIA